MADPDAVPVVDLIRGTGEKTLVEITIVAGRDMLNTVDGASATTDAIMYATLVATSNHPFWNASRGTWTTGADLEVGDQLLTSSGQDATVATLHVFAERLTVHNLTIANTHTYLVAAGDLPVVVHNCPSPPTQKMDQPKG